MQQGMVVNHSYASRGDVHLLACIKGWCLIGCMHQGVVFSFLHALRDGVRLLMCIKGW